VYALVENVLDAIHYRSARCVHSTRELFNALAECTCVGFLAVHTGSAWTGPLSVPKRPKGWKASHEAAWEDHIRFNVLTEDVWNSVWSHIPAAMWEEHVYGWRATMESVVGHYIECQPEAVITADDHMSDYE
jgi:hypothetical protein